MSDQVQGEIEGRDSQDGANWEPLHKTGSAGSCIACVQGNAWFRMGANGLRVASKGGFASRDFRFCEADWLAGFLKNLVSEDVAVLSNSRGHLFSSAVGVGVDGIVRDKVELEAVRWSKSSATTSPFHGCDGLMSS